MSNKGLIESLSSAKRIIPVDSIVSIKNASDGKLYTVLKVTIEQNGIVKYLLSLNETGIHNLTVYENKVVLVKKSKDIDTLSFDYENQTSDSTEEYSKILKSLKTLTSRANAVGTSIGAVSVFKVRDGVDINSIDDDTIPFVSIHAVKANSYVYNRFVMAGDCYVFIYHPNGKFEMMSRDVTLKPFYKRIFNTLLYGRDNSINYDINETVFDYRKRRDAYLLDLYSNQYDAIRLIGDHITP